MRTYDFLPDTSDVVRSWLSLCVDKIVWGVRRYKVLKNRGKQVI